jgi:hypothetical protein
VIRAKQRPRNVSQIFMWLFGRCAEVGIQAQELPMTAL